MPSRPRCDVYGIEYDITPSVSDDDDYSVSDDESSVSDDDYMHREDVHATHATPVVVGSRPVEHTTNESADTVAVRLMIDKIIRATSCAFVHVDPATWSLFTTPVIDQKTNQGGRGTARIVTRVLRRVPSTEWDLPLGMRRIVALPCTPVSDTARETIKAVTRFKSTNDWVACIDVGFPGKVMVDVRAGLTDNPQSRILVDVTRLVGHDLYICYSVAGLVIMSFLCEQNPPAREARDMGVACGAHPRGGVIAVKLTIDRSEGGEDSPAVFTVSDVYLF